MVVCISTYLKSALRYKFKIRDAYHRTLYLCGQGCEDPWLFFDAKSRPRAKQFERTLTYSRLSSLYLANLLLKVGVKVNVLLCLITLQNNLQPSI